MQMRPKTYQHRRVYIEEEMLKNFDGKMCANTAVSPPRRLSAVVLVQIQSPNIHDGCYRTCRNF